MFCTKNSSQCSVDSPIVRIQDRAARLSTERKVALSCWTLCDPVDYTVRGILYARILEWVAFPFSRRSSQPRDQTQVSHIAGGFFTSRATGKRKNTGVGNLSLMQQIFPTQELNRGLLHCRQVLYQLSYQVRGALLNISRS